MAYRKRVYQFTLSATSGSTTFIAPASGGSKLVRVSLKGSTISTTADLTLTDSGSNVLYSATGRTAAGVGTKAEDAAPTDYAEAGAFVDGDPVTIAVANATSGDIIKVTCWFDV